MVLFWYVLGVTVDGIFVAWVIGVKDIFNWTTNILTSPVISYSLAT